MCCDSKEIECEITRFVVSFHCLRTARRTVSRAFTSLDYSVREHETVVCCLKSQPYKDKREVQGTARIICTW